MFVVKSVLSAMGVLVTATGVASVLTDKPLFVGVWRMAVGMVMIFVGI